MPRYGSSVGPFEVLVGLLMIILSLSFGCGRGILAREESAIRALETQGYTEVKIVDHAWFAVGWRGCDEKDAARFTARAKNPVGQEVTVYVCSGLLKGGTIRTP